MLKLARTKPLCGLANAQYNFTAVCYENFIKEFRLFGSGGLG